MSFRSFAQYVTEETKEIVVAWGRYNPPTIGHEKLMTVVKKVAGSGQYRIYASQSQDPKENPLEYKTKVKYLRKMFPKHARNIMLEPKIRTMFDLMTKLYDEGFNKVTLVAGSDRVTEYDVTLNKYNGVKGRHGFYNFEGGVNIVSAGQRDPDAKGAAGMSASKLRAAAENNDFKTFSKGMPSGFKETQQLFNDVRKGMGLKESYDFRSHLQLQSVSEEREAYVSGELFNEGDVVVVKESDEVGQVIMRGSNYVLVEMADGKKLRKWITDIDLIENVDEACWDGYRQVGMKTKNGKQVPNCVPEQDTTSKKPQDPDADEVKGSQPKGYYKDVPKDKKVSRAKHFKKYAKMDDDDPKAYKPAPGDKDVETKPSKFTKKFKKMYGEQEMNPVDKAKERIEREKETDKKKHDRMMDRARLAQTKDKNQEENVKSFSSFAGIITEDTTKALQKKADKSGMPLSVLRQVYNRGVAAWRTGHRPGTTPSQWGMARVNSFVTKSSGTWGKADKDLAAKVRGN